MAMNWSLYQRRETAAQIGTVISGVIILVLSHTIVMGHEVPVQEEPISLSIVAPPVAPDQVVEQPVQKIQPPPQKVIEPPKEVVPVTDAPAPAIQKVVEPQPPKVVQAPKVEQLPKPVSQAQPKSNFDAENQFAQDLKMRIERKKIYPDAARDLGITGHVEIEYELNRSGNLLRAEIVSSSGSKLLDQAALRSVKSISPKRIPDDAWMGKSSMVFRTKLDFSINE